MLAKLALRIASMALCLGLAAGPSPVSAQAVQLTGRVVDAKTQQPVPHAQVGIANNRLGTSTNDDGRFVLPIPPAHAHDRLTVALLGYRTYSQPLPARLPAELRIALEPAPTTLGEVQVSGSVLGIVREAVARIPQNYPVRPFQLTGFYRESEDEADSTRYHYLAEAVLSVFKPSYNEPSTKGQIVIQQSRKVDLRPKTALFRILLMGGPFMPLNDDFVHHRHEFINEADFKNYDYKLVDLTTYDGQPVYVIAFGPKAHTTRANYEGRLYIDQQRYAFLAAEWQRTPAGLRRADEPSFSYKQANKRVEYQVYDGKYYLKRLWSHFEGKPTMSRDSLRYLKEFLTTAIDTTQVHKPSYVERAQVRDIFRKDTLAYDSAFWRNYATLLPPAQLRQALREQERQRVAERLFAKQPAKASDRALSLLRAGLSRLRFAAAVGGAMGVEAGAADVSLLFAPPGSDFRVQAQGAAPRRQWVGYSSFFQSQSTIQVDLTPSLSVYCLGRRLMGELSGTGREFGATYAHNFTPRHRPIRGRVGVAYTRQRIGYELGTFANPDRGLRVAGTKLNADRVSVAVQDFTDAWQPRLGVGVELSHRLEAVADLGYLMPWHTRRELHLAEESGFFLFRNDTDLALPAAGATVQTTGPAPRWSPSGPLLTVALFFRLF